MMVVSYSPGGVALALVVMTLGSHAALALLRRARAVAGSIRLGWLAAGAFLFGLAVWVMHVVALAATACPIALSLDPAGMALSLVIAVPVIGSAFLPLCCERPGAARVIVAGVLMGLGVCVLHYLAMAAMRDMEVTYDPLRVTGSAFLAAGACTLMLLLSIQRPGRAVQFLSSAGLGLAIAATHYLGMSAASFRSAPLTIETRHFPLAWITFGIAAAAVSLFIVALAAALLDRRIAEMAARENALIRNSRQQLRTILEQLPLGIGLVDGATGELAFVNRRAHALLGAELDRAVLDGALPLPSADAGVTLPQRQGPTAGRIVDYTDRDGRRGNLEVWANPVRNADGADTHVIYAFQDVTSRLDAEIQLRQAHKMEALGQLTGGIAHDFNNLLTAILGSLDLLSDHLRTDEARHLLRNATEATERGARLTSQLLGFSRRQAIRPEIVHMNEVVAGMAELLASTLGGTVKVIAVPNPELWPALADRTQIELVILNLAINARDAMPVGGTILIRTENVWTGTPQSSADPPAGEHVLLSVSDSGTGMSAETLARVFEPFFTTKAPGKGSGLGLSQVLGIAQQLGGGVRIASEELQGTTVQLFLPRGTDAIATAPSAPAEPAGSEDASPLAGRTILLVDDDDAVRVSARATLAALGCVVIEAGSGAAALATIREEWSADLDAVVMDYAMPEMTGLEAAKQIERSRPDLPILLVTGYADPDMLGTVARRFPVLGKPFRSAQLAAKLAPMLRPRRDPDGRVVPFPSRRNRAPERSMIA